MATPYPCILFWVTHWDLELQFSRSLTETRVGSSLGRAGRVMSVSFKGLLRSDHFGGQRPWKGEGVGRRLGMPRETAGFREGQVREKAGDSSS